MSPGWFVTGTDTDAGKTLATSALITALAEQGKKVVGMKPVASGCTETCTRRTNEDADRLYAAGTVAVDYDTLCPYRFLAPIAPHLAAVEEGVEISIARIAECFGRLQSQADHVVVEGVGGWAVPVTENANMADVAVRLGLPVIIVVGARLGCINHALLTQQAVIASGLPLAGWIYNQVDPDMQRSVAVMQSLQSRMSAPLLGYIPHLAGPDVHEVASCLDLGQI